MAPHITARALLVVACLLAFGLALAAPPAPGRGAAGAAAQAPAATVAGEARGITVAGEGRVAVRPDLAHLVVAVETAAPAIADAQRDNAARTTAVLGALKALGLADQDLQTIGYNVFPQYSQPGGPGQPPAHAGYRVSTRLRATVRDLGALSDAIAGVVAAGATGIQGVAFDVSNRGDAVRQAREAAVADARARAEQYARLAGVQLGPPVAIVELAAPRAPQAGAAPAATAVRSTSGDGPPLEAGEGTISVTVQITYELR